jgi:hypothetical protein
MSQPTTAQKTYSTHNARGNGTSEEMGKEWAKLRTQKHNKEREMVWKWAMAG